MYCTKCNSERLLLLVVVVLLSVLLLYWCILRMQHNNLCCCIFPHAAFDRIILFKDSSSAGQLLSLNEFLYLLFTERIVIVAINWWLGLLHWTLGGETTTKGASLAAAQRQLGSRPIAFLHQCFGQTQSALSSKKTPQSPR